MDGRSGELSVRLTNTLLGHQSLNSARWLFRPLFQLLATGELVTVEGLVVATGRSIDEVRHVLAAQSDTEFDDQGRIAENGLTLRPMPHHFVIDGRQLYTWCAFDTLLFPALLGRRAEVESPPQNVSGQPVRLTVDPDSLSRVDPPTAVVSLVTPDAGGSIRGAFCHEVHFFATADEASGWLEQRATGSVVPVDDAHRLGRPLVDAMSGTDGRLCC